MKKMTTGLVIASALYLSACSSSSDTDVAPIAGTNEIGTLMNSMGNTLESATESSGLGSATPVISFRRPQNSVPYYLAEDSVTCTEGGFYEDYSDDHWAIRQLHCLSRTPGTGPDTLLGAFNQARGFVCGVGSLVYDGVERDTTLNITSACFSQEMVDMAKESFGKTAFAVKVQAFDISSTHKIGTLSVNSAWTKALQLTLPNELSSGAGKTGYTILIKDDAGPKAAAVYAGRVLLGEIAKEEVFAVYVNPGTSGSLAYEARIATVTERDFSRHLRLYMSGNIDANTMVASDVQEMGFVWGDGGAGSSRSGRYASAKGTPAAGRKVLAGSNNSLSGAWNSVNGDDKCYGEGSATCSTNSGIAPIPNDFSFFFKGDAGTGHISSYNWFLENSYLSHFDMDITMDDVQP